MRRRLESTDQNVDPAFIEEQEAFFKMPPGLGAVVLAVLEEATGGEIRRTTFVEFLTKVYGQRKTPEYSELIRAIKLIRADERRRDRPVS